MNFKNFNILVIFGIFFLFSVKKSEKNNILDDYYTVEKNKEFKKLIYTRGYNDYKDILYSNVVFDLIDN